MSIAPVRCTIEVPAPPARAFALFVGSMGAWWPRGRTPGAEPHVALVVEPEPGGRWFERDASGRETEWGRVLAFEPPHRLVLGWQLDASFRFDPELLMEVELRFDALAGGGTRVSLEHRDLERLAAQAEVFAGKVRSGWPERLADYARLVASPSAST